MPLTIYLSSYDLNSHHRKIDKITSDDNFIEYFSIGNDVHLVVNND